MVKHTHSNINESKIEPLRTQISCKVDVEGRILLLRGHLIKSSAYHGASLAKELEQTQTFSKKIKRIYRETKGNKKQINEQEKHRKNVL